MDNILSLKHNKKKARPNYLRYIKGTILEIHGLRSLHSFDSDMARFDKHEIKLLLNEILLNLANNKKTKLLCIIESKMSGLPHIIIKKINESVSFTQVYQGKSSVENFELNQHFKSILLDKLNSLFDTYPEIWIANNDTESESIFARYSSYNNNTIEYIEIVSGHGLRDINSQNSPIISCIRQNLGDWRIKKSQFLSDNLKTTLNKFKSFIFQLKSTNSFEDWSNYIKNLKANGFSLDFRFKNERFDCIDYDTSAYSKTISDAIKFNKLSKKG